MIWWYCSSCSAWTCMCMAYKKQKPVTSQLGWYDVPPTATRRPWILTCTSSTSATSVIWRNSHSYLCSKCWNFSTSPTTWLLVLVIASTWKRKPTSVLVLPVRVDDVPGQIERQPAATSRSLFQYLEEWEHLDRRLPVVPERVTRERHEDHERFPCVV
jgi:hypothetical protein